MHARVRATLPLHAATAAGAPVAGTDPNGLVPAPPFAADLDALGPETARRLGQDYARLWARTFRTLVRHLRGRPEQALRIFSDEVYPFLRGDRRAARVERTGPGRARILLSTDLPPAYLDGLVAGFVGLSGAHVTCTYQGHEAFDVRFRIGPADRFAWLLDALGAMRIPFIVAAALAAIVGAAPAMHAPAWRIGVVIGGVTAVQAAANALHEIRGRREGGPFAQPRFSPWLLWSTVAVGYGAGAAAGVLLSVTGTPWVAAWAMGGFLVSLLFALVHDRGWGPFLAGLTYGPVVATGAAYALVGWQEPVLLGVLLTSLPLGAVAAAHVTVHDLADRPLDEAAGRRTLVVRLPRAIHLFAFALPLALAAAGLWAVAWWHGAAHAIIGTAALALAAGLVWTVGHHLDDPRGLAPARLGMLMSHLALGIALAMLEAP